MNAVEICIGTYLSNFAAIPILGGGYSIIGSTVDPKTRRTK
jgi:hypothetical protein